MKDLEEIAKHLIKWPYDFKPLEILPNGYRVTYNGKVYEIKVTEYKSRKKKKE